MLSAAQQPARAQTQPTNTDFWSNLDASVKKAIALLSNPYSIAKIEEFSSVLQ
ncbi:MAG: hypothetical protein HC847_17935 [Hydrococcus sp. RU_2_2]|nr:hypothetical protein [Hydrococcus sp. RU_2_2]NJP18960.1 hypothetical protein [Hydrococcus sp. CRU_1_1]